MGSYRTLPLYVGRSFNLGKEDEGDEVGIVLELPLALAPSLCPPLLSLSLSLYIYIYIYVYIFTKCSSMYQPPASSMRSYVARQLIA